jgi:hypothetical protein
MMLRIICTVALSTLIMMMSACSRCEAEKTILEIDSAVERESLRIVLNGSELPLVSLEGCFQKSPKKMRVSMSATCQTIAKDNQL